MGRAYSAEMDEIPSTIVAALERDLEERDVKEFRGILTHPLVAIGVGGSTTAAHFAARQHRDCVGLSARVATTLEYTRESPLADEAALIISAGGRNKDALAAYATAREHAREVAVWTVNPDAPLGTRAKKDGFPFVFDARTHARKDGFLATNTLMSTLVLGARLYEAACGLQKPKASVLADVAARVTDHRRDHAKSLTEWTRNDSVLVLHAGWGSVAAADLETRLHEAALAHVHTADLRSFAHGRHLWLAHRAETTSIVALISNGNAPLFNRVKKLLPKTSPLHEVIVEADDWTSAIELVAEAMLITEQLGIAREKDPGRPRVPDWGRKIYSLGPGPVPSRARLTKRSLHHAKHISLTDHETREARKALGAHTIRGLVLDLDGTLLERRDVGESPQPRIYRELNRLLNEGLVVGLASGRGKSLYDDLHEEFDKRHADRVILGFYEGSIVQRLSDGPLRKIEERARGPLVKLKQLLDHAQGLPAWFTVDEREHHLGIRAVNPGDVRRLSDVVEAIILRERLPVSFGSSSLGLDVYPKEVSKLLVVDEVAKLANATPEEILRIGDRGERGGNDYEMLNHPLGLSVNLTHPALMTCQNLAPPGTRGPNAALYYLKHLRKTRMAHTLQLEDE